MNKEHHKQHSITQSISTVHATNVIDEILLAIFLELISFMAHLLLLLPHQAEGLDGGKRWKNDRPVEERAPSSGFGSPSKGQAINLLDTVSTHPPGRALLPGP